MKKLFSSQGMIIALSFLISFIFYSAVAVLVLSAPKIKNASKTESRIARDLPENYTVLTCCDELLQYSAIQVNFYESRIIITLFSSRESAETYGFSYDRRILYSAESEKDAIARIGGIVISEKSGYNGDVQNQKIPCRIFGKTAVEFARQGITERSVIAEQLVYSLLFADLTNDDFSYLCERIKSDISFADFYKMYKPTFKLANKISVVNECESN